MHAKELYISAWCAAWSNDLYTIPEGQHDQISMAHCTSYQK